MWTVQNDCLKMKGKWSSFTEEKPEAQRGGPFNPHPTVAKRTSRIRTQIWPVLFVTSFWAAGSASVIKEGSRSSQRLTETLSLQGPLQPHSPDLLRVKGPQLHQDPLTRPACAATWTCMMPFLFQSPFKDGSLLCHRAFRP